MKRRPITNYTEKDPKSAYINGYSLQPLGQQDSHGLWRCPRCASKFYSSNNRCPECGMTINPGPIEKAIRKQKIVFCICLVLMILFLMHKYLGVKFEGGIEFEF